MKATTVLFPDLVYRDGAFESGLAVEVDAATGRVGAVTPASITDGNAQRVPLPRRALMPGFVNAHSHAFQRLIRGRTQWRPTNSAHADFWSWRSAMYDAALSLSPDDVYRSARSCFLEMLHAGYTSVGEFHYLQRDAAGREYDEPALLARRVVDAARDIGIRICLLNVAYARGGIGSPLAPEQRRFATPDLDAFLAAAEQLIAAARGDALASVGVAPHSVRAVPRDWLRPLHAWAAENDTPFHIHVAEQPAEVDACLGAYGRRPVELLHDEGVLDARLAAVHATHLVAGEVELLGNAQATVVACPTTERDLGDGILHAAALTRAGAHIAIGSDSQTIIDPFEEMRLIEYHERLRTLRRVVVGGVARNGTFRVAPTLLTAGTAAGARAIGIDGGRIEAGAVADLVAIDLDHRILAGADDASLADTIALCGARDLVTDVWVHGVHRVQARVHDRDHDVISAFREPGGAP